MIQIWIRFDWSKHIKALVLFQCIQLLKTNLERTCRSILDISPAFTHHYWMMFAIIAWNTDRRYSPLLWVFTKSSVLSQNELKEAKRSTLSNAELLPDWKYLGTSRHLPEDLIAIHFARMNAERDLLFVHGLQRNHHDVLWAIFPGLPSDLRGTLYLASEEELITAGLGSSLKKCLTVTGGGCCVHAPVHLKLFLGKSLAFLNEHLVCRKAEQLKNFRYPFYCDVSFSGFPWRLSVF